MTPVVLPEKGTILELISPLTDEKQKQCNRVFAHLRDLLLSTRKCLNEHFIEDYFISKFCML